MKLDFPVMVAVIVVTAVTQELLPSFYYWGGTIAPKIPILPAVALYYSRHREWPIALTAALWCGIFSDGLGEMPRGTTTLSMLVASGVVLALRDVKANGGAWLAAFPGVLLSFWVSVIQAIVYYWKVDYSVSFWWILGVEATILPVVALVAVLVDYLLTKIEFMAGNVEPRKESVIS